VVDFVAGVAGTTSFTSIEKVVTGDFNDRITGNAAAQNISARAGADTLWGAGGIDTLWGGSGADTFIFREMGTANADVMGDWTSGQDTLLLDGAVMSALGASGDFTAGDARFWSSSSGVAHDADDRIIYNTTTRQIFYDADGNGSGAAQLIGTLQSGATLVATDIAVEGGSGGAQTINGTSDGDSLVGGPGNDTINALAGDDTLSGAGGDDRLDGGPGADSMLGGAGDDFYFVDNAGDEVVEQPNEGIDEVRSSLPSYMLSAWVDNLTLLGGATNGYGNEIDNVISGNDSSNRLEGGAGNDTIFGFTEGRASLYPGNDTLIGGEGNDSLVSLYGDDLLDGGAGSDTVWSNAGSDTILGGAGDDELHLEFDGSDFVDGGLGIDTLLSQAAARHTVDLQAGTLATNGGTTATIRNIENVVLLNNDDWVTGNSGANFVDVGDGNDTALGYHGNDTLTGGGGDDVLDGMQGADLLIGGDGNDTMYANGGGPAYWDGAADTMSGGTGDDLFYASSEDVIADSGGIDGVVVQESWALADDFENLYFAPGDFIGIGNSKDNWIAAGTGTQWLDGRAGNDTVSGGEGNDTLLGGAGNDFLSAGFGFDRLEGGAGNDTMVGLYDANTLAYAHFGAANADVIRDFHLGSNSIELDGVAFANIGPSGSFASGDGRFHAAPGAAGGHDADDRVIYNTTTGQLWYDADGSGSGGAQLIARLEGAPSLSASQISVVNGRVSPAGQVINGTSGADTLADTAGNDTINGLAGNDTIKVGSGGSDVVNGGDGRDSLEFMTATGAVVVDFVAGVAGSTSFTNIEKVVTGDFNDQITGNAAAQNISARAGADTLAGGGGVDTLWGGTGADTFVFRETGTANADTIGDWTSGSDELALDNAAMGALGADGAFVAGDARFWASSTGLAHDANDRVIYNSTTRQIFYDADGNGSGAAQLIATVQAGGTIAATDISVI
jgi:Ca2+-binding RTX toxin-like protein